MVQKRRDFIKVISLMSASVTPVAGVIAQSLDQEEDEVSRVLDRQFNEELEFHFIDNNLSNIHYYFINVEKKRHHLCPADYSRLSYMIIRLPQMHISERGFWYDGWADPVNQSPSSHLSGFSYLAFRLWPDQIVKDKKVNGQVPGIRFEPVPDKLKRIRFSLDSLLDWNYRQAFDLITLVEWFELKASNKKEFQFRKYNSPTGTCSEFTTSKVYKNESVETTIREVKASAVYQKYRGIVLKLLDQNLQQNDGQADFVPVTFFEIPQALCLIPFYRDYKGGISSGDGIEKVNKKFWNNYFFNQEKQKAGTRKYEVWNNHLYFQRQQLKQTSDTDNSNSFVIEKPFFRAAGLITTEPLPCPVPDADCTAHCATERQPDHNILPSLLDKTEIAYLTQYAKSDSDHDFTSRDFDIQEVNGLFMTGLGIITHLKYENTDRCPPEVDLIEYEHIITQGRDIFIRVARLGYNCKTAQRYKHVIEGTRKIDLEKFNGENSISPVSFIELKQYCECIDRHISYVDSEVKDASWRNLFQSISIPGAGSILNPVTTNYCDYKRNVFTELTVSEKKRIPIDCLREIVQPKDICTLECIGWFWPIKESPGNYTTDSQGIRQGVPDTSTSIEYLMCEYDAKDWEDQTSSASTPFMFIRKSYLENPDPTNAAYLNYFKGNPLLQPTDPLVERRKTFYSNKKIAYTTSPPNGKLAAEKTKNKVNILTTEFIETYFNLKLKSAFVNGDVNKTKYVLYPQLLRAKVYVDHIRELTLQNIPSIIEYHEDYIAHQFDDYSHVGGSISGNGAKLILKNTSAYLGKVEENANNTYAELTVALKNAKNRLGNLAVPDIIPNTISLEKFGITMPSGISAAINTGKAVLGHAGDALNKLSQISPDSILGNTEVCGIKATDILHVMVPCLPDDNHTPLFNINKLLNQVEGDVVNSSVYQKIIDYKVTDPFDGQRMSPGALLKKYTDKIQELNNSLEISRNKLNAAVKTLSNQIPDTDSINHLVKDLFERYRTAVFDMVLSSVPYQNIAAIINNTNISVKAFLKQQTQLLNEEFQNRLNDINFLFNQIKIANLPPELKTVGGAMLNTYIISQLTSVYNLQANIPNVDILFKAIVETDPVLTADNIPVYYVCSPDGSPVSITFELTQDKSKGLPLLSISQANLASVGVIQLQNSINNFQQFITKNIHGTGFQVSAVKTIQTLVAQYNISLITANTIAMAMQATINGYLKIADDWCQKADDYLLNTPNSLSDILDAIASVRAVILKTKPYADFIRKYDPTYYYTEQQRLKLQIKDVQRRFFGSLMKYFGDTDISGIPICPVYDKTKFTSILCEVQYFLANYQQAVTDYLTCLTATNPPAPTCRVRYDEAVRANINVGLGQISSLVMKELTSSTEYQKAAAIYADIDTYKKQVQKSESDLRDWTSHYQAILQQEANTFAEPLEEKVLEFINDQTVALTKGVSTSDIATITEEISEARNIYQLITSIKQQELNYTWSTQDFKDTNFGIISFKQHSNPNTTLKVNVKATTYFSSGKFPPTIDRISTRAENYFTDFALSFFDSLIIGFTEVSYISGSDIDNQFSVKIKDVQFGGALSFVQAFESWLKTLGKGLILRQENGYAALGYSLPIPGIQTPAFSFFNLSLNFDLRVYFDHRPIQLGFSLATEDSKFGIAAFIYAGFGFFSIVADPKNGIVEIDCALEAGAWAGISIGPISGEVKLAFGFRYTKNQSGIRLEGYIVAEGRLTVWILEVSARIYLGIVSENGVVEGICTVTYSVKLGFVSKSFSGSFHQRIAGSQSNNEKAANDNLAAYYNDTTQFIKQRCLELKLITKNFAPNIEFFKTAMEAADDEQVEETYAVSNEDWKRFINQY